MEVSSCNRQPNYVITGLENCVQARLRGWGQYKLFLVSFSYIEKRTDYNHTHLQIKAAWLAT